MLDARLMLVLRRKLLQRKGLEARIKLPLDETKPETVKLRLNLPAISILKTSPVVSITRGPLKDTNQGATGTSHGYHVKAYFRHKICNGSRVNHAQRTEYPFKGSNETKLS